MTGGGTATDGDKLAASVSLARDELAAAVELGDLRRDPLRFVLGALSSTLGVFPDAVRRVEAAAAAATGPTLSPKAEADLLRRVEAAAQRGAASAGPAVARRTGLLLAVALAGTGLAGGAAGFAAGRASVPSEVAVAERDLRLSLGAAQAWLPILRANPDPRPLLAAGRLGRDERSGWRVGTVTLYLEPEGGTPRASSISR